MDFKPIQQQKIYEQIVEQIKVMISEGDLKPGDKLPAERVLAENLNVSRASVREALSALHLLGLLEIKSGEGTYIKQSDVNSIIQPLAMLLLMEQDTIVEILEVRKGLEVEAAGLAALNATDDDIRKMGKIIDEMEREMQKSSLGEVSDWKFHFSLVHASKNSLMVRLMNTISDTMQKTIKINREKLFKKPGNQQTLFRQHYEVYVAVRNRDVEMARQKMYEHLKYAEEEMKQL
ncbi:MAG TPA: FadR/GntR family transcriptional regulator [Spirochaetota bacterium]|nr:FadR/GntR family transcriptional regulator [Spirochaetota bacterium]HPJ35000.1 FadR/GntR family transcriptional regulator [Spirochaetota bacterium]